MTEGRDVRHVILMEHISLDGYLAGPEGEMDWINVDDDVWDYVHPVIDGADVVVWGRVTYQMMEGYWPTAPDKPDATRHDIHHGRWLRDATKIVFSNSLTELTWPKTKVLKGDPGDAVASLKRERGKDILLIGSASLAHSFIRLGLIDQYRLTVNPVLLRGGTPLFPSEGGKADLKLVDVKALASGVVALHYQKP
jgi:dihydrofolate reductase